MPNHSVKSAMQQNPFLKGTGKQYLSYKLDEPRELFYNVALIYGQDNLNRS